MKLINFNAGEAVNAFVPGPIVLFFLLPVNHLLKSPSTPSSNAWETLSNQPEKEVPLLSAEE
jgi:hypothetical protein